MLKQSGNNSTPISDYHRIDTSYIKIKFIGRTTAE